MRKAQEGHVFGDSEARSYPIDLIPYDLLTDVGGAHLVILPRHQDIGGKSPA